MHDRNSPGIGHYNEHFTEHRTAEQVYCLQYSQALSTSRYICNIIFFFLVGNNI